MAPTKTRLAAVDGWFTMDGGEPVLLASRCTSCGTYVFPKKTLFCPNPTCGSADFEEARLSRTGKIWSYTDAQYQPPPPYVAADPYVPFCIAAVELADEKMVVMGQVVDGVKAAELRVGMDVELVVEPLYEDDEHEYMVWKWRPQP